MLNLLKKFYSIHTPLIEFNTTDVTHRTKNLIEPKSYVWYLADTPHILKTARNCIYHSGNGNDSRLMWKEGNFITLGHLRIMLDDGLESDLKLN